MSVRIKSLEALNAVGNKLARQPANRPREPSGGRARTGLRYRRGSLVPLPTESRMDVGGGGETRRLKLGTIEADNGFMESESTGAGKKASDGLREIG